MGTQVACSAREVEPMAMAQEAVVVVVADCVGVARRGSDGMAAASAVALRVAVAAMEAEAAVEKAAGAAGAGEEVEMAVMVAALEVPVEMVVAVAAMEALGNTAAQVAVEETMEAVEEIQEAAKPENTLEVPTVEAGVSTKRHRSCCPHLLLPTLQRCRSVVALPVLRRIYMYIEGMIETVIERAFTATR